MIATTALAYILNLIGRRIVVALITS